MVILVLSYIIYCALYNGFIQDWEGADRSISEICLSVSSKTKNCLSVRPLLLVI